MHESACQIIQIAENNVGLIKVCHGCGQVSMTLQFMTIRLEPVAFDALVSLVHEAQKQRVLLNTGLENTQANFQASKHPH